MHIAEVQCKKEKLEKKLHELYDKRDKISNVIKKAKEDLNFFWKRHSETLDFYVYTWYDGYKHKKIAECLDDPIQGAREAFIQDQTQEIEKMKEEIEKKLESLDPQKGAREAFIQDQTQEIEKLKEEIEEKEKEYDEYNEKEKILIRKL